MGEIAPGDADRCSGAPGEVDTAPPLRQRHSSSTPFPAQPLPCLPRRRDRTIVRAVPGLMGPRASNASTRWDPVGLGHVASLAQPGGNITGMSMLLTELAAKGLEVMTESLLQVRRIGLLWNPTLQSWPMLGRSSLRRSRTFWTSRFCW
jgi:hypothetical protein